MTGKTVLLVDDEQGLLEPLSDALQYEGHRVLTAKTVENAIKIFKEETVHLATIDIMLPPGKSLEGTVSSHEAGIYLCKLVAKEYPKIHLFCLSVVSDVKVIRDLESYGVRFLRKGETPLQTVLNMIRSRLTGVAYSTELDSPRKKP